MVTQSEQNLMSFHENVVFGFTISLLLMVFWLPEEMQ